MSKQVKNQKVFKNGAIGGYVKQNDGSWKWRIIGNIKKKQHGGEPNQIFNSVKGGTLVDVSRDQSFALISQSSVATDFALIYHIDITTGKLLKTISLPNKPSYRNGNFMCKISDIKISPDMSCFFVNAQYCKDESSNESSNRCIVYKINLNSKETTILFNYGINSYDHNIRGLAVSNDMSFIFIICYGMIIRFNLETKENNVEYSGHHQNAPAHDIILSNDNQFALVICNDNKSENFTIYKVNLNQETKKLSTDFSKIYSSNYDIKNIKLSYDDLSIFIATGDKYNNNRICKLNLTNSDNCLSIYSGEFRDFAITSNFLLLSTERGIELTYFNIKNFNNNNVHGKYPIQRTWLTNSKNISNNNSNNGRRINI
jgi:hypothetical protein